MGLITRIYYNAVFGALGGLLGWMLFSIFGNKFVAAEGENARVVSFGGVVWYLLLRWFFAPVGGGVIGYQLASLVKRNGFLFGKLGAMVVFAGLFWVLFAIPTSAIDRQLLQDGGFIGAGIGYLVVSVEAIRDRSWLRFVRLASYGIVLGTLGGAAGMWVAEHVNYALVGNIGAIRGNVLKFLGTIMTRGLGFMFLGLAVGLSEGIAARSLGKLSYGTMGGTLGGFLGGCLFGLVYELTKSSLGERTAFAGAAGFVIMGACIGSLSALVQGVFQPASVKVLRGWQEGREYPLDKNDSLLGRDEHADIALFRDMKVEKKHAVIQREGARYLLLNNGAPTEFTRVNDVPVPQICELHDGDRIQLGNVILRFQLRAAQNRARPRTAPAVPASEGITRNPFA
jgi:hypothetical protein